MSPTIASNEARPRPSLALVLETNNLAGAERAEEMTRLEALMTRLRAQTFPLTALRELVLTHCGLTAPEQAALEEAAGAPLRFVELPEGTGYYAAKNRGFLATSAEVVAFGDADCWPDPTWLTHLMAPFAGDERVAVVAGKTLYKDTILGAASTAVDFQYWPSPLGEGKVRNFYANNVAFRRTLFTEHAYPHAPDLHRGHCTLLAITLAHENIPIHFAPQATTRHPLPTTPAAHLRFRLRRGEDTAELTAPLMKAYLPPQVTHLPFPKTLASLALLGARFGYATQALSKSSHPTHKLASLATVAALTAADALGVLTRRAGIRATGNREEDAPLEGWTP